MVTTFWRIRHDVEKRVWAAEWAVKSPQMYVMKVEDALKCSFRLGVASTWRGRERKQVTKLNNVEKTTPFFVVSHRQRLAVMYAHHLMVRIFLIINIISSGFILSSVANRSCTLLEIGSAPVDWCTHQHVWWYSIQWHEYAAHRAHLLITISRVHCECTAVTLINIHIAKRAHDDELKQPNSTAPHNQQVSQ